MHLNLLRRSQSFHSARAFAIFEFYNSFHCCSRHAKDDFSVRHSAKVKCHFRGIFFDIPSNKKQKFSYRLQTLSLNLYVSIESPNAAKFNATA